MKNPGKAPLRSHGALALNALRAQDLLTLSQARGGFLKRGANGSPGRRFLLTLYANFLRGSGAALADACAAVRSMAAACNPPWPDEPGDPTPDQLTEAEYSTDKRRRWKNDTLCALLGISAELARELDLKTIRPLDVALDADQARPHLADVIEERRDFVRQYIEAHGMIKARALARVLHARGFIGSPKNQQTANQDLNALGFVATRSRGGRRPRKAAP